MLLLREARHGNRSGKGREGWQGGESSAELSLALLTQSDIIRGYWDGTASRSPKYDSGPRTLAGIWTRLARLDAISRQVVIDDILFRQFRVQPTYQAGTSKPDKWASVMTVFDPRGALGNGNPLVNFVRPETGKNDVKPQLALVGDAAGLRADRLSEIDLQQDDILSFFGSAVHLHDVETEWTLELLTAMVRLAGYMDMPLKHFFDVPRPIEYAPEVLPILQTPTHGSWPIGHATEAFAVETIIDALTTESFGKADTEPDVFSVAESVKNHKMHMRIAARIADNRTIAGLHFPVDSIAGAILGVALGEAVVNYAIGAGKTKAYAAIGTEMKKRDFDLGVVHNELVKTLTPPMTLPPLPLAKTINDGIIPELFNKAREEQGRAPI